MLQSCLEETKFEAYAVLVDTTQAEPEPEVGFDRMPLTMMNPPELADLRTDTSLHAEQDLPDEVEFGYDQLACTVLNCEETVMPDNMLIYKVTKGKARTKVVNRDYDILTPEEVRHHCPAVCQAMQT